MTLTARLALLTFDLDGGGAERVMVTLANAFRRAGHDVDLVCVQARGVYRTEVDPDVRVIDLKAPRSFLAVPALSNYLRHERPAALLSTLASVNVTAAAARLLARVPTRLVVREAIDVGAESETAWGGRRAPLAVARRWAYRRADHVVAPSAGVADGLRRDADLGRVPITVIPNPLDFASIDARAAEAPTLLKDGATATPIVLGIGRLSAQKDFQTMLRAFARLTRGSARLLILGEGEDRGSLERLARELGIADDVQMPGFVDNPFAYLRRASVYVLSSRYEGLPNTLLQAMAIGTPVVATDCPSGPREALDGGRWGRLVPVGDEAAMAAAIAEALDGRVPAAPREVVAARHAIGRVMRQYLDVLHA